MKPLLLVALVGIRAIALASWVLLTDTSQFPPCSPKSFVFLENPEQRDIPQNIFGRDFMPGRDALLEGTEPYSEWCRFKSDQSREKIIESDDRLLTARGFNRSEAARDMNGPWHEAGSRRAFMHVVQTTSSHFEVIVVIENLDEE